MELEQRQLWTYLHWLQESGQIFAREAEWPREVAEESEEVPEEKAAPETPKALPSRKLVFLSESPLEAQEEEMVDRIAAALGLRSEDYVITSQANVFSSNALVVLGSSDKAAFSSAAKSLVIPHPSAMLRDPSLKRSAWDALQNLKAELH